MVISELSQKRGLFNKKKITLKSDKLIVEETTVQSKKKYEIDLDEIGYKKYYEADNTAVGKIATLILFIIPLFLYRCIHIWQNRSWKYCLCNDAILAFCNTLSFKV